MIKQAMIFAAGLGKRMLPVTKWVPKPLVKINDKSLLVNNVKKLLEHNFDEITINAYHFPEKIIKEVKQFKTKVNVVIEEERLETGGGLINCLKKNHLSFNSPVLLLNSDVYWIDKNYSTINLLIQKWNINQMDFILCMKNKKELFGYHGKGDFDLLDNKSKCDKLVFSKTPNLVFTGLQIINPKILSNKEEKKFSLSEIIKESISKHTAFGFEDKNPWFHIGTPEDLKKARELLV